jgi:hypothetical protein
MQGLLSPPTLTHPLAPGIFQCIIIVLPITIFLEGLFESANEVEGANEGWLSFSGKWPLLFGANAMAGWHWRDKTRESPSELVRWLAANESPYASDVRSRVPSAIMRALTSLFADHHVRNSVGIPPTMRHVFWREEEK